MAAPEPVNPPEHAAPGSRGYCPACGAQVLWTPTAHLWPSPRAVQSVLPTQSGICPRCQRVLMYTVVSDPAADAGGTTR